MKCKTIFLFDGIVCMSSCWQWAMRILCHLKNAAACTRRYRHCKILLIPNMKIGKTKPILVTYSVLCNSWWCIVHMLDFDL